MIRIIAITALLGVAFIVHAQDEATETAASPTAPDELLAQSELKVAEVPQPEAGYRFAKLTAAQRRALRPRFRLPMEVLFQASSLRDLRAAAEVQPVPDPHRPLLPVKSDDGSGDPFAGGQADVPKFDVLNKLFAAELAAASEAGDEASSLDDASGLDAGFADADAFAPVETVDEAPAEEAADDFDDPFADF